MARPLPLASACSALCAAAFVACGGGGASAPKGSSNAAEKAPRAPESHIGNAALAQGGLAALGGAGNREQTPGGAARGGLRAERMDKASAVKLDGILGEWPARTAAHLAVGGPASGTTFAVAVQYDDAKLYVGGEVTETSFVRTLRFSEAEEHASLVVAFPGAAPASYEIAFYAGQPGQSVGKVSFASGARKGQEVPGAKIVEAPADHGYTFEAILPWSTFPEARLVRVGLRGVAR